MICVYITHAQIYIHNYTCTITRSHTCVHAQRRMHLRVQPYMCACLSSHTHAAMHNYVRTCKVQPHTHVYTHMYVLMQPCTYLCTCKHAHARMHLHANIYMYKHIYLYMYPGNVFWCTCSHIHEMIYTYSNTMNSCLVRSY